VWQIATWQKQYGIDDHYVIRHADINQVDRPYCPNPAFFAEVKSRLGDAVVEVDPVFAEPRVVLTSSGEPWKGIHDITVNDVLFHGDKKAVTVASDGLRQRKYATTTAAETGPSFSNGDVINVLGWVHGEVVESENRWWITNDFSRVWVGGTNEKPSEDAPAEQPDALPDGVRIVGGRVYYPAKEDGKTRKLRVIGKANLRKEPTLKSDAVGVAENGDELLVRYWTFGQEVKGERIWWLTYEKGKDPFKAPKHLWAASTDERPQ